MALPNFADDSIEGLRARLSAMQGAAPAAPLPTPRSTGLDPVAAQNLTQSGQSLIDGFNTNSNLSARQKVALAGSVGDTMSALGGVPSYSTPSGLSGRQAAGFEAKIYSQEAQRALRGFAEGGKPGESADELIARIQAKYNVSGNTAPVAAAPAAPAPRPQPQPDRQPGGLLQQTVGLLNNRRKQLEQATQGYACGGKPMKAHAQGGKIQGPGTPTSDSIPAKVSDTGEPILVSTQERILSKAQDDLLLRIAQALGFSTVEALLESGTGQPVGPTIKGGKQAAALGGKPGYTDEQGVYHPASVSGTPAPAPSTGPAPGVNYEPGVTAKQVGPLAMMAQAYGGQLDKLVGPNTDARLAANRAGLDSSQEVQPTPSPTAQIAAQPPAAGPVSTVPMAAAIQSPAPARVPGQKLITNASVSSVDDSASAMRDQKNSTYNPARQLENMQRLRLTSDALDPTITDPNVRTQAMQGLAILNASRTGADASAISQQNTEQARVGAELRNKLLDPNTSPEERARVTQALHAINGKAEGDEVKIAEATTFDPSNPMVPLKTPYGVTRSGKVFDVAEQAKAQKVTAQKAPAVPKVGEVRGGFKFKGGNPADQNAWEKA